MASDTIHYLPNDILTKVDRAAMAVSLETRIPFLDHRVLEFAWSLPFHYKVKGTEGKSILRKILYNYVPKELIERPKMGFGIPLENWLKDSLRPWAEELLNPSLIKEQGLLNEKVIQQKWKEHLSVSAAGTTSFGTFLCFKLGFRKIVEPLESIFQKTFKLFTCINSFHNTIKPYPSYMLLVNFLLERLKLY